MDYEEYEAEWRTAYDPAYFEWSEPTIEDQRNAVSVVGDERFSSAPRMEEKRPRNAKPPSRLYAFYKWIEAAWVSLWVSAIALGLINVCLVKPLIRGCVPDAKKRTAATTLRSETAAVATRESLMSRRNN